VNRARRRTTSDRVATFDVIAATNRDLIEAVAEGTFRQDLFYRLNVFPLEMPPVRERQDDIAVLVEYFINRYARKAGKTIRRVSKRTLERLKSYPWPGMVAIAKRDRAVGDACPIPMNSPWTRSWYPATRCGAARNVRRAGFTREGAHRRRTAGHRRASVWASGAACTTRNPRSTLESKIRTLRISKSRFRTRAPKRFEVALSRISPLPKSRLPRLPDTPTFRDLPSGLAIAFGAKGVDAENSSHQRPKGCVHGQRSNLTPTR